METMNSKSNKMILFLSLCILLIGRQGWTEDFSASFAKLKNLVGKWEGTAQWTGARTDTLPMQATYYLTGHGTALVEDLGDDKEPSMTSVYHMDGTALRLTHYCGVGNQPRFRATTLKTEPLDVSFEMVDITNMPDPQGPHVSAVEIALEKEDQITLIFTFTKGASQSTETIHLTRVHS
jgi:hypothetical protein